MSDSDEIEVIDERIGVSESSCVPDPLVSEDVLLTRDDECRRDPCERHRVVCAGGRGKTVASRGRVGTVGTPSDKTKALSKLQIMTSTTGISSSSWRRAQGYGT